MTQLTWDKIPGWYAFPQLYEDVVRTARSGVLIEVGTYLGKSLCHLGQLVKESGKPLSVVGVDTCRGTGVENGSDNHGTAVAAGGGTFAGHLHKNVIDCGLADTITLLVTDSLTAASLFPDNSLPFVMIDAAHDYQSVCDDIRAWLPKVCVGGMLAGDDVGEPGEVHPVWPGVRDAINKMLPGWEHFPHAAWVYKKR